MASSGPDTSILVSPRRSKDECCARSRSACLSFTCPGEQRHAHERQGRCTSHAEESSASAQSPSQSGPDQRSAGKNCSNGGRPNGALTPSFRRSWGVSRCQGELQCVLSRTRCNTHHASGALHESDLHKLIHRKMGRADSGTLAAVDAGFSVATNLCGAK